MRIDKLIDDIFTVFCVLVVILAFGLLIYVIAEGGKI
jgi:hypothetical protein